MINKQFTFVFFPSQVFGYALDFSANLRMALERPAVCLLSCAHPLRQQRKRAGSEQRQTPFVQLCSCDDLSFFTPLLPVGWLAQLVERSIMCSNPVQASLLLFCFSGFLSDKLFSQLRRSLLLLHSAVCE